MSDHCQTNCCVDPILAPCFFVIFVLISQFVLVNVVVAVLMKHLEESNKRDEAAEANAALTDTEELKADTDIEDTDAERGELVRFIHFVKVIIYKIKTFLDSCKS